MNSLSANSSFQIQVPRIRFIRVEECMPFARLEKVHQRQIQDRPMKVLNNSTPVFIQWNAGGPMRESIKQYVLPCNYGLVHTENLLEFS